MSALELLVAVAATAATARGGCVFTAPSETGTGCTTVDLTGLPAGPFILNDSWPEPYLVGSPCGPVDITACERIPRTRKTAARPSPPSHAGLPVCCPPPV